MAWSKAKTALVATAAVLLAAGIAAIVVKTTHASRIAYTDSEVTQLVSNLKMEELRAEDCTPEFWQQLQERRSKENPEFVKALPAAMGELVTVRLVERTVDHGRPSYLFHMGYEHMNVLFRITLDGKKIAFAEGKQAPK